MVHIKLAHCLIISAYSTIDMVYFNNKTGCVKVIPKKLEDLE